MKLIITHINEQKIKTLSDRLKIITKARNSYQALNNSTIKAENLKLNLSFLLAHIIINLNFLDRSKETFLSIIKEYNDTNNKKLDFESFEKTCWIRYVRNNVVIPELVRNFIWKVNYNEENNLPIEILPHYKDILRCLQLYSNKVLSTLTLNISKQKLELLLNEYGAKGNTIENLVQKGILKIDSEKENYNWLLNNDYTLHLRNEIAATIWLIIGGDNPTLIEFEKFFNYIYETDIWVDDLDKYLDPYYRTKLFELSIEYLQNEKDLDKSEKEFTKIWLDSPSYLHIDINQDIPNVLFNYENIYKFIESINIRKNFQDSITHQETRVYCKLLLRIILMNDYTKQSFKVVLDLLKDTSKPYLVWTLFNIIPNEFPEVIPYLLLDSELALIAFKQIEKIEVNTILLSKLATSDYRFEEKYTYINQYWVEIFDFILDYNSTNASIQYTEIGSLITNCLLELSTLVFSINARNNHSVITHKCLMKRYREALKLLMDKRITNLNGKKYLHLIPTILPTICNQLKEQFKTEIYLNEFLPFETRIVDLCIEILRYTKARFIEIEVSEKQINEINQCRNNLVEELNKYLIRFYSITEINMVTYNSMDVEKRIVKRGLNDFGFEIIDWGYLFLHFEINSIFENLDKNFNNNLSIQPFKDEYEEHNRDQNQKIHYYLKSLILAHLSIVKHKNSYQIEGLPVKEILTKLEQLIIDYSIKYSRNKAEIKKIDVFDERYRSHSNEIYYQPLIKLLYSTMNNFNQEIKDNFIEDFFEDSNDLGRMLAAINILGSKRQHTIISKRIAQVKIEDFINESFQNELLDVLIESINSENHWSLAKPILDKLQLHYEKTNQNNLQTMNRFFEVKLLLAYKERDFNKLFNMNIPRPVHIYTDSNIDGERIKNFFISIYKIYNDKDYDFGLPILKKLLQEDNKNLRYAYHIYRAETLKANLS